MFISLGTNEFRTEAHGQGSKAKKKKTEKLQF